MALTATFAANFADFDKSLSNAQVHLKAFDRGAATAARDVTRHLESISGQRVAVEAARMAEAIKRLGGEGGTMAGLMKLTDAELRRVTATMDAAADKAARLGEALPDSLRGINAEIAKLPKPVEASRAGVASLTSAFGQLTASFTAGALLSRGIDSLIDLGREAIGAAGDLVDLRAATGESLEMLQRWGHVADQGGIQLEQLTDASFKLGARLDGGSDSVRAAVEALGLSFETLRDTPGQLHQVLVAADALGPSQQRNTALVEIFGNKSAQQLARVADGYRAAAAEATVAGDRSVEALDRASAAFDRYVTKLKTAATQEIGDALQNMASAAGGFTEFTEDQRRVLALAAASAEQFGNSKIVELLDEFRKVNAEAAAEQAGVTEQQRRAAVALQPYVALLEKAKAEIAGLSPANRQALDAARELGHGFEELATHLGLSEDAQQIFGAATKENAKALKVGGDAADAYRESLAALSGAGALDNAAKAMQRLQDVGGPLKVLPSQLDGLRKSFEAGAEAAWLIGDVDLAAFYQQVAKELTPIAQLQDRYNVTIGEYVTTAGLAEAATAGLSDQFQLAAGEATKIGPTVDGLTWAVTRYTAALKDNKPASEVAREAAAKLAAELARRETATALRELSGAFASLAQSTGGADGLLGTVGELIGLMSIGATAGDQFRTAFDKMDETNKVTAAGLLQMASAAAAAIGALENATDRAGQAQRALGGAAVGAQIGAQFGPKGAAIGAGVGALVGILRNPAFEDVLGRVGRDWGVTISEELARGIADEAKAQFGGSRQAAELFNLDKILGEAGGLSADNLQGMTAKLRDVFVMLETGSFTSAQAVEVLDENFQDFIAAATDGSGRLSQEMTEIIRLAREFGVESEAVTGYVRDQAQTAIAGANAVIGYLTQQYDAFQGIADGAAEAQRRVDELNRTALGGRGSDWTADMAQAQADLTRFLSDQHAAGEAIRGELELVGQIAVGVYGAAIEAGLSHSEALKAAQPGLEQLVTAYENLGISATDAGLAALLPQAELLKNNPQLLAGVDGLAQSFTALSNLGLLNVDTFQQMQQAGLAMFSRIQGELAAQGVDMSTNLQALIPMQDYLRAAAEQAERLGVPLDANTQILVDQSKELGLWSDEGAVGAETIQDAMGELNDTLRELIETMGKIPRSITTDIDTRYHQSGGPTSGPQPTPGPSGEGVAAASRAAAGGGDITTRVYLDGREVAMAVAPHRRAAERAWGAD